jgi:hypothetical protein
LQGCIFGELPQVFHYFSTSDWILDIDACHQVFFSKTMRMRAQLGFGLIHKRVAVNTAKQYGKDLMQGDRFLTGTDHYSIDDLRVRFPISGKIMIMAPSVEELRELPHLKEKATRRIGSVA